MGRARSGQQVFELSRVEIRRFSSITARVGLGGPAREKWPDPRKNSLGKNLRPPHVRTASPPALGWTNRATDAVVLMVLMVLAVPVMTVCRAPQFMVTRVP